MHPHNLLLLSLTFISCHGIQGSNRQDMECAIIGECSGIALAAIPALSYNECLHSAASVTGAVWFTFFSAKNNCVAFSECINIDDSCLDCRSGKTECPDIICHQEGACFGNYVNSSVVESEIKCAEFCQETSECSWSSFYGDSQECTLTSDCLLVDDTCNNCVSNEKNCLFP